MTFNQYNVTTITEPYTASNEEYIISDGSTVTLPEPSENAIVAVVSRDGTRVPVEPNATELVEFDSAARVGTTGATYFVSDGTNWYLESGRENVFGSIPDSVIEQFNAQSAFSTSDADSEVNEWKGELDNITLTGDSPIVRENGINGFRSLEFDGVDDHLGSNITDQNQPITIFMVFEAFFGDSHSEDRRMFWRDTADDDVFVIYWDDDSEWTIETDSDDITGTNDSSINLLTGVFDGSDSVLRENGSQTGTGNLGSTSLQSIRLGNRVSEDQGWDGYIGFCEIHDGLPSNGLETREQDIADLWDINLD